MPDLDGINIAPYGVLSSQPKLHRVNHANLDYLSGFLATIKNIGVKQP